MQPALDLSGRRLLAVFAHPDDEAYSCAGTLALCAAAGARVEVAALTRGEAGADLHTGLPPGPALGSKRADELREACRRVGARPPRLLGLVDGQLEAVGHEAGRAAIAELLAALRPQVVLGADAAGVYGHRDHRCCHRWLCAAVATMPAAARPRLLLAAFPRGLLDGFARNLARSPHGRLLDPAPAGGFGIERVAADLVVDVRSLRDAKRAALAAHRSQLADGRPESFVLPGIAGPLLAEEWFTLAAGPPLPAGASHPFAGR